MILGQKVGNLRPIQARTFFFKDHYDFGAESRVFCLFGPPIFSMGQNGPRLKKVGHPYFKPRHALGLFLGSAQFKEFKNLQKDKK